MERQLEPIPQPKPWPLLGNIPSIDGKNGIQSLMRLAAQHGPIFRLRILGRSILVVGGHDLVDELCDETRFAKKNSRALDNMRPVVGDGLFTAYNDEPNWDLAHRLLTPAFGPLSVRGMFDRMLDIAEQMLLRWERFGDAPIDVADQLTRLTLDTIALCAFDFRFNSFYQPQMHPFVAAMLEGLEEAGRRVRRPEIMTRLMVARRRHHERNIAIMHGLADDLVARRRAETSVSTRGDLLDKMLAGRDPSGQGLGDDNIRYQMVGARAGVHLDAARRRGLRRPGHAGPRPGAPGRRTRPRQCCRRGAVRRREGGSMTLPRYRLGFDIGGTFTDFVLVDEVTGAVDLNKCLTTPDDPSRGVMDGLAPLLAKAGIGGGGLDIAIHATTLITNALIERAGAKTALLATEGFRDIIEMGTEVRYDSYDLRMPKPEPLVPRNLRFGIAERMAADGEVVTPLDEASVRQVAAALRDAAVESVAVIYLHAFRNPAHEQRTGAILRDELPGVSISLASAVAPEIREYERMSTTAANAYVQPITRRYLDTVDARLQAMGCGRRLFMMISSGGIAAADTAKELPIRMLESGPAAGVLAAIWYGRRIGVDSMVTFDMGGTTAKIGLVKNGEAGKTALFEVGRVARFKKGSGLPVKVPMIELIEIGAGGGSIAEVDALGLLKVGPRSAGASPGPACYGRGGTSPTVTDANVVLGYLDPGYFLGGAMTLDQAAARHAIDAGLAKPLGLSVAACARGIFEVVNQNMLAATKVHIAERGEDPRKFYLFAFGGAGPAHAYELARTLRMRGVIVPTGAGAASAAGLVTAGVSFDYARSLVTRLDRIAPADVTAVFDQMAAGRPGRPAPGRHRTRPARRGDPPCHGPAPPRPRL